VQTALTLKINILATGCVYIILTILKKVLIMSLTIINQMDFVMEPQYAFCEVEAKFLIII
jgi:hypothetical protein